MITLRTVSFPAATRPTRAPALRNPLPRARDADAVGSWHYPAEFMRWHIPYLPLLIAASVHGIGLFGLNWKPAEAVAVVEEEAPRIVMLMPNLEELEEEEAVVDEVTDEAPLESADYVPMLADVPGVNLDSAFVQKLDFSSLAPRPNLDATRVVSIPVGPRTGTQSVRGNMKDLFDLKDLDSVPSPVFQPAPVFPVALKREVEQATVVVEFIVNSRGKVVEAEVVDTSYRGFEDAAIAGVMRWQFRPGIKGGRPVNTRMRVPLVFRVLGQ